MSAVIQEVAGAIQEVAGALPVIVFAVDWGRRMMVVLPLMKLRGSWFRTVAIAS